MYGVRRKTQAKRDPEMFHVLFYNLADALSLWDFEN
jgi:hypothetical protein